MGLKTSSIIEVENQFLMRILDTNGNGTGTKSAVGDYTTPDSFYIQPPAGRIYRLNKLLVHVGDTGLFSPDTYGAITELTNGVLVELADDTGTLIDFTDGDPVVNNGLWTHMATSVVFTNYGASASNLQTSVIDFIGSLGAPVLLDGDDNDKLQVTLQDDLSGLDHHHFVVHGYWYDK